MNQAEHPESHDQPPYHIVEKLSEQQIGDVCELIQNQWWGGNRTLEQVRTMLNHTSLTIAVALNDSDRIIGFCRTLTDFTFRATIYDVVVATNFQQRGIGKLLLNTMCQHPRLQSVNLLYLACEPKLFSFYEQWGFKAYDSKAHWMMKTQHPETPPHN